MSESQQALREVGEMGTRVANIEQMMRFSLSANPQNREFAKRQFKAAKNSAEVYLALVEAKTQEQLCKITKLKAPRISTICTHLEEQGFISRIRNPENKKQFLFMRNDVERTLGLSRIASECRD